MRQSTSHPSRHTGHTLRPRPCGDLVASNTTSSRKRRKGEPVVGFTTAADLAKADNLAVLAEQLQAPLTYETGGLFPVARLCPRALQQKAKEDAQQELALLLRTPVFPLPSAEPTETEPTVSVLPPSPLWTDADTWEGPIGRHYRRVSSAALHRGGGASSPVTISDDDDDNAVVSDLRFSNSSSPSRESPIPVLAQSSMPSPNGATNVAVVMAPELAVEHTNSWAIHPYMAAAISKSSTA